MNVLCNVAMLYPDLLKVLRLYKHDYMVDVWYQNLEKSSKINKNIDLYMLT